MNDQIENNGGTALKYHLHLSSQALHWQILASNIEQVVRYLDGILPRNMVGGWASTLKNMSSSIGMMNATQYFWENKPNGNQTTNQKHGGFRKIFPSSFPSHVQRGLPHQKTLASSTTKNSVG